MSGDIWVGALGAAADGGLVEAKNAAHATVHRPVPDDKKSCDSRCQ